MLKPLESWTAGMVDAKARATVAKLVRCVVLDAFTEALRIVGKEATSLRYAEALLSYHIARINAGKERQPIDLKAIGTDAIRREHQSALQFLDLQRRIALLQVVVESQMDADSKFHTRRQVGIPPPKPSSSPQKTT